MLVKAVKITKNNFRISHPNYSYLVENSSQQFGKQQEIFHLLKVRPYLYSKTREQNTLIHTSCFDHRKFFPLVTFKVCLIFFLFFLFAVSGT